MSRVKMKHLVGTARGPVPQHSDAHAMTSHWVLEQRKHHHMAEVGYGTAIWLYIFACFPLLLLFLNPVSQTPVHFAHKTGPWACSSRCTFLCQEHFFFVSTRQNPCWSLDFIHNGYDVMLSLELEESCPLEVCGKTPRRMDLEVLKSVPLAYSSRRLMLLGGNLRLAC